MKLLWPKLVTLLLICLLPGLWGWAVHSHIRALISWWCHTNMSVMWWTFMINVYCCSQHPWDLRRRKPLPLILKRVSPTLVVHLKLQCIPNRLWYIHRWWVSGMAELQTRNTITGHSIAFCAQYMKRLTSYRQSHATPAWRSVKPEEAGHNL